MEEPAWRIRLLAAIDADRRSDNAISEETDGVGRNFVGQFRNDRKMPGVDNFLALCDALNVSPIYIITGLNITSDDQEMIRIYSRLRDEPRAHFLRFLRSLDQDDEAHE